MRNLGHGMSYLPLFFKLFLDFRVNRKDGNFGQYQADGGYTLSIAAFSLLSVVRCRGQALHVQLLAEIKPGGIDGVEGKRLAHFRFRLLGHAHSQHERRH